MTNNPTIDGVLQCKTCRGRGWIDTLRPVGSPAEKCPDCAHVVEPANDLREHCKQCAEVVKTWPEWKQNCLGGAPVVERQPDAFRFKWDYDHGNGWSRGAIRYVETMEEVGHEDKSTWREITPLYAAPPEVAALQSTIDQLQAENARIKSRLCVCSDCGGHGEVYSGHSSYQGHNQPPEPDMDVCGNCGGDGVLGPLEDFESLATERDQLQARVQELENARGEPTAYLRNEGVPNNLVVCGFDHPDAFKVFKAPPAPVSVVLPERKPESTTAEIVDPDCNYSTGIVEGWNACLDATAALNEVRK